MIIPTKGRILIKKLEKKVSTDSGILMANATLMEESLKYGEIVSEGHKLFSKGTKIFYSRYSATKVADGTEVLYLVSDLDIMAIEK